MAGGYQVGIASETKAFKQGVEAGIIEPLEDAQKELLDLGKNKGPEQLERAMKDAEKATDRLKDETKDTARAIEQEFRDSYRQARKSADDGLDGMKRHTEEATGELKQNLGETFSSFRGDLEDLPQIAQDVFGGMASGVDTLAGSLALAGGAAGIGLLIGGIQGIIEQSQKAQQEANDLAQAYIDAGSTSLDALTIAKRASDVLMSDDADTKGKLEGLTAALGDEALAARALAGDTNALAVARDILAKKNQDQIDSQEKTTSWTEQEAAAYADLNQVIQNGNDILDKQVDQNNKAAETYRSHSDILKQLVADAGTATEGIDELGNKLYTLPDGQQIMIDAETGQATANIDKFKGDVDEIEPTVKTTAIFQADTSQFDRAVRRINGTTLRVGARIVTSGQGWD